jgi:hypothetical protein
MDEVISSAKRAGGSVVREGTATSWGCSGYSADPHGLLWKVALAAY